jgi:NAD(P)-dependent dehydrogenase (short-subunit alcohol dehydrogenase family)
MSIRFDYSGKVAFVSGAGTGIGQAAAIAFASAGASVALIGRTSRSLTDTLRLIEGSGGRGVAIECDVSKEEDVIRAISETTEKLGRLDFAFNNAGVEQPATAAADLSSAEWHRQIGINLDGVFYAMKHQIAWMAAHGGGAIVNTSSGAGMKGFAGQAGYCAAKFGVIGLTKAAALDCAAQNIRVNAVSPGIISTPMMDRFTGGTEEGRRGAIAQEPIGRAGHPDEIAGTVLWLCSDLAAFTVGAAFVVDGGQTA